MVALVAAYLPITKNPDYRFACFAAIGELLYCSNR